MQTTLKDVARPFNEEPDRDGWQLPESTLLSQIPVFSENDKNIYTFNSDQQIVGLIDKADLSSLLLNELKRLHSFQETILRAMNDAVTIVNESSEVLAINHRSEELYQLNHDEVKGRPLSQFFDEEALVLWSVMKDKQPVMNNTINQNKGYM